MPNTLLYLILCSLLITQPLMASDSKSIVMERGNGEYFPNEMMTNDNQLTGVHIEIIRAVAKLLKIRIEIKSLPWNRALHLMEKGKADAITHIGKTPEREKFAIFHDRNILSITRNGFFILKENSAEFNFTGDLQQLRGYRIGVLNGYSYGDLFDGADYLIKDTSTDTEELLFDKLIHGRFSVAISNVDQIYYIAKRKKIGNKITFLQPYLQSVDQYIAFSKSRHHQQLDREFVETLTRFKTTQEYRQILTRYGVQ